MKIPSNQLEAFHALCLEKNFSRAATKLGLSQPAFSHRIMGLEDFLESTLVIRERGGILLTEAGEKLLRYAQKNLELEQEFLSTLQDGFQGLKGQIRIGGFSSIMRSLVLPTLAPLLRNNPELSIQTFTAELEQIFELLRSGRADFIIHNKEVKKEGYRSVFLGFEDNVLVGHKKFRDLDVYLDHDENDVTTSAYFKLARWKMPAKKRYLDDVYGLIDGVRHGLGKAVIPRHMIKDKNLEILNPNIVLRVPVYLLTFDSVYYSSLHQKVEEDLIRGLEKSLT